MLFLRVQFLFFTWPAIQHWQHHSNRIHKSRVHHRNSKYWFNVFHLIGVERKTHNNQSFFVIIRVVWLAAKANTPLKRIAMANFQINRMTQHKNRANQQPFNAICRNVQIQTDNKKQPFLTSDFAEQNNKNRTKLKQNFNTQNDLRLKQGNSNQKYHKSYFNHDVFKQ